MQWHLSGCPSLADFAMRLLSLWAKSNRNDRRSSMIRHIVLFTAKDKAHVDKIVDGLSVLAKIPHARRLEVARNRKSDRLGNEIDVIVYGEFDDEVELEAYKAHELYQESIRQVRPLRELRLAADYSMSTDAEPFGRPYPRAQLTWQARRGFWVPVRLAFAGRDYNQPCIAERQTNACIGTAVD